MCFRSKRRLYIILYDVFQEYNKYNIYITCIPIGSRSLTHTHTHSPIPFPIGPPQILFPHTNQFFRALARRDRTHGSNPADRARIINIIINLGCSCRRPKTTNPNCRNKSGGPHRGLVEKNPKRITKLHI